MESYYTDVLSGTDGREFGYLDENSDLQRTIVEPTNGNTIVSTLDINIQQVVEKYIAEFDAEYGKDAEDGKGAKTSVSSSEIRRTARFMRWRATTDLTSRIRTI